MMYLLQEKDGYTHWRVSQTAAADLAPVLKRSLAFDCVVEAEERWSWILETSGPTLP